MYNAHGNPIMNNANSCIQYNVNNKMPNKHTKNLTTDGNPFGQYWFLFIVHHHICRINRNSSDKDSIENQTIELN